MIRRRDGTIIPMPEGSNGQASYPAIVVRIKKIIHTYELQGLHAALRSIDTARTRDYAEVIEMLQKTEMMINHPSSSMVNTQALDFDYVVTIEDLEAAGGALYVPELDMVIQLTADPAEMKHHPYSKEVDYLKTITNLTQNRVSSAPVDKAGGVFYYIVDNFGKYGPKFTNIDGMVIAVPVMKDEVKQQGVYRVIVNKCQSGLSMKTLDEHYTFEEAEKHFKLFKTFQEAANFKENEKAELENRNKELSKEIDRQKDENALLKAAHESDAIRLKKELEDTKHANEVARLKLEREHREASANENRELERLTQETRRLKEELDRKQSLRKDRSDNWKFISALIMTMLTAGLSVNKIKRFFASDDSQNR